MELPNPLLKLFHTPQHPYLYCGKTNRIFRLSPAMADIIRLYGRCSLEEIMQQLSGTHAPDSLKEGYTTIDNLSETYGLFKPGGLKSRVSQVTEEESARQLSSGVRAITLEVTENCNCRCRYCTFSGGYSGTRAHGSQNMDWETAKAAIDFLYSHSKDAVAGDERPSLSFYGGEPLLRFDLIQKCIEYAESLPWAHPQGVHWSVTINGTLLNEKIARFLLDHNVGITFSLDGPTMEHDRNRVYADGRPTFDHVLANIREYHSLASREYYENQVLINCVVAPDADLMAINDFFVEHHDLCPVIISSPVREGHKTFFAERTPHGEEQSAQRDSLFHRYVDAHLTSIPIDPRAPDLIFLRSLFEKGFLTLYKRDVETHVRDQVEASPACFPGKRKLLVDTLGRLFTCERVDRSYPIGSLQSGFDVGRVINLTNEYAATMNAEDCLNCWAFRFCSLCYLSLLKNGHISLEAKQSACASIQGNAAYTLSAYCYILEQNPAAFKYMDSYMIL